MSRLIYSFLASLDGYIADDSGTFDWAVPDEEVLDFINATERDVGTYLYGRTMYEIMIGWENDPAVAAQSPKSAEFAQIWQVAEKIVFSRSLESVSTKRTRLERSFDPGFVRQIKAEAGHDLNVSGADVAASAWHADLVDECHVFIAPMLVGGRQADVPRRPSPTARPARRAPLRKRHDLPSLRGEALSSLGADHQRSGRPCSSGALGGVGTGRRTADHAGPCRGHRVSGWFARGSGSWPEARRR